MFSFVLFAFALCATAQGRAVNISNTWVLPEEGFPVFYRYFRDRISWYEADAVCQFHHANLVTVDTTAQYDAVRAYLKELDISSAVWVGLIRSNPDGDFTWTDYRGLGSDGYWSSAPDPRAAPLCAAADPAADYRWEARACGGPTVASFICELPVPQWALGNEGCMVKALPALTVLYLPESAAVQLTADCGLAGVKRVQCTGNVKREDLLKDLSCAEDDETSITTSIGPTGATSTVTSENLFTDQDNINEVTTEENTTTEHEDDINQSSTIKPITIVASDTLKQRIINKQNEIYMDKNLNLDVSFNNNLQSNDIPKLAGNNNYLSSDLSEKLEDEKNKQHKMLHDEFARHGNFETIFTQPTDHFVPPLVMAKARISDDMTVLSLEEKHAQQLAEQQYAKQMRGPDHNFGSLHSSITPKPFVDATKQANTTEKPLFTTENTATSREEMKKDIIKNNVPKKYSDKYYGLKAKNIKMTEFKQEKTEKSTETNTTHVTSESTDEMQPFKYVSDAYSDKAEDEPTIDLTVIIKEPDQQNNGKTHTNYSSEIPTIEIIQNDTSISEPEIKLTNPTDETSQEISVKLPTKSRQNITLTHEVIRITILKEENSSEEPTVIEVTTKMPVFEDDLKPSTMQDVSTRNKSTSTTTEVPFSKLSPETAAGIISTTPQSDLSTNTFKATDENTLIMKSTTTNEQLLTTGSPPIVPSLTTENVTESVKNESLDESTSVPSTSMKEMYEIETESEDLFESNTTDTSQTIDDFQSPLLSAANEPLHRPNRSRRPQPPPIRNKFNPFRILG